ARALVRRAQRPALRLDRSGRSGAQLQRAPRRTRTLLARGVPPARTSRSLARDAFRLVRAQRTGRRLPAVALTRGSRESACPTSARSALARRRPLLRAPQRTGELARRRLPLPALPDRGARTRRSRGRARKPEAGQTPRRRRGVGGGD